MSSTQGKSDSEIIENLRSMALNQSKPSELLKFLTVELGMTDQIDIMQLSENL